MIRTITSEWIKLRTILAHKILVLVAVAFPIVVGVLAASFGDVDSGPDSVEMAEFVTSMMVVTTMLLGVISVIGLTSEYTHNTLRPTYAATPQRMRVLASKLIVSWAAIQTARTRSMESATGLLYINVGTIAAGTILAAGLYFGAGLLV